MKKALIIFLIVIIAGIVYFSMTEPESTNTSNSDFSLNINIPELEPVTINENALPPEATESYKFEDLNFKLPSTYKAMEVTNNKRKAFITDPVSDEQYAVIFYESVDLEEGLTEEQAQENMENNIGSVDISDILSDFNLTKNIEKVGHSVEKYNNIKYFVLRCKGESEAGNRDYVEINWIIRGNKLYTIAFMIEFTGEKTIDSSRSNQFYNIKNSFYFD